MTAGIDTTRPDLDWIKRATTVAGEPLKNYTDPAQEPTDGDREFLTFCKYALDINHRKWLLSLLDHIEELEKPLDGNRDCGCPCGECRYGHDR